MKISFAELNISEAICEKAPNSNDNAPVKTIKNESGTANKFAIGPIRLTLLK